MSGRQYAILIQKNPLLIQIVFGEHLTVGDFTTAIKALPAGGVTRVKNIFKSRDKHLITLTLNDDWFSAYYKFRLHMEMALAEKQIYRASFRSGITLPGKSQDDAWEELNGLAEDASADDARQLPLFSLEDVIGKH